MYSSHDSDFSVVIPIPGDFSDRYQCWGNCLYIYICIYMYIYVYIYVYMYIYIYINIYECFSWSGFALENAWYPGVLTKHFGFFKPMPDPVRKMIKISSKFQAPTLLVNDAEISPFFPTIPWTTPTFLIQHWTKYQISINIPMIPMVWDVNYRDQVHLGPVPMSRVALLFNV